VKKLRFQLRLHLVKKVKIEWIKDGNGNATCPNLFCLVEQPFTAGILNRLNQAGTGL
jgi:hypothetical protein